jgi:hypothetical protein
MILGGTLNNVVFLMTGGFITTGSDDTAFDYDFTKEFLSPDTY